MLYPEKEEGETALGRDGEANNATDCNLENYLRAFWDFHDTRKRKQRFENGIGKAYENEPKLYSRITSQGDRFTYS
jgi:hypothetical protein